MTHCHTQFIPHSVKSHLFQTFENKNQKQSFIILIKILLMQLGVKRFTLSVSMTHFALERRNKSIAI